MSDDQLLEFHYYLADGSHSIDALRLNKLEAEALDVFLYISNRLGYDVVLEATAATEGGYRQIWRFVRNPKNAVVTGIFATTLVGSATVASSVLNALIAATVQIWVAPAKPDAELESLQRELLRKSIEEKELDIAKKRKDLETSPGQAPANSKSKGEEDKEGLPISSPQPLQTDMRVVARRSNYYRLLLGERRVTGIGLSWCAEADQKFLERQYIPRDRFVTFIVPTEPSEPKIVQDAFVEIVAPVIRSTDTKWRGVYLGKSISFAMRDTDFKSGILRKGIQFQSGDAMSCILRISYKINEIGEEVVSGYEVLGVARLVNTAEINAGDQRTSLKYESKLAPSQLLLNFLEDEDNAG